MARVVCDAATYPEAGVIFSWQGKAAQAGAGGPHNVRSALGQQGPPQLLLPLGLQLPRHARQAAQQQVQCLPAYAASGVSCRAQHVRLPSNWGSACLQT